MPRKALRISLIVVAVIFGVLSAYAFFFLSLIRVPTGSMANTVIPGDHIAVERRVGQISRGDIVIFRFPGNPTEIRMARVIGLPGERIQMRDKTPHINGVPLQERRVTVVEDRHFDLGEISYEGAGPYSVFLVKDMPADDYPFAGGSPFEIPDDHYFVMGDNRDNSHDSRYWGAVAREAIVGKPWIIYWSSRVDEPIRWERLFNKVR